MSGEIISVAQMCAIDAASAEAGAPTSVLMENAGRAVAHEIAQRFSRHPVVVLCGPGNNGGDGWEAARALQAKGWPVRVETLVPREALSGDAARAAALYTGDVREISGVVSDAELYVDALFGAGLSRPLEGVAAQLADGLTPEQVIAVDVPSGLEGDSGKPLGDAVFQAGLTVTFVRKKPAHVLMPGRALCGEVVVADIGAPEHVVAAQGVQCWENGPARWRLPWPEVDTHKHERGHVLVASGGLARAGAARLAARAALRIGAGLVTLLSPKEALAENAAQLTAIMLREVAGEEAFAAAACAAKAMVIGPAFGLEAAHRAHLQAALTAKQRRPLVLDADALTLVSPLRAELGAGDVLTPHVGEFRRLFPGLLSHSASRLEAARAAAAYARCVVLLKGPDTVIAAPDGRAIVNLTGTPFLATAGSGDVLAGLIAGLIAQGLPSFEAAAAGAWLHGRVGERLGPGLIAEDLCEILPALLNDLAPSSLKRGRKN